MNISTYRYINTYLIIDIIIHINVRDYNPIDLNTAPAQTRKVHDVTTSNIKYN